MTASADIPYASYLGTFDRCSAQTFDRYRLRFRQVRLLLLTLNMVLVSLATVVQGVESGQTLTATDTLTDQTALMWENLLTLVAGASALILRGIEQTIGLTAAELECATAHSDLTYFLTTRRAMPQYIHARLLRTNTLWYPSPGRCKEDEKGLEAVVTDPEERPRPTSSRGKRAPIV